VHDIVIPKLNTVDVTYTLVEWLFGEGEVVPSDAPVAIVETSKAAQELTCESGGVLHRVVVPPAECELGTVIGHLFASREESERFAATHERHGKSAEPAGVIVTKYARDLMTQHEITDDQVGRLGKKVIQTADIELLITQQATEPEPRHILSRAQRAVADVVTEAHKTIPAAFSIIKIYAAEALRFARQLAERERSNIGIIELLVKCVAVMHSEFPLFFAAIQPDGSALLAKEARIGITVDVGKGLYVPVVKNAFGSPISRVAKTLMEFRIKALRGSLTESDLAGGNIAISINDDTDIVLTQPLILPPNVCMLALCAMQSELYHDTSSQISGRQYFYLGLSYDHRLINGREAAQFLSEIKKTLETPGRIRRLEQVPAPGGAAPAGDNTLRPGGP
jgi:2-oxoglutarate dehydrogenase E2 component (dihydrolipoamide succinyltransferase)